MNISLGIHVGHDRGACIIKDGEVIASIANERLDRIKHSDSTDIPYQSIDALLKKYHLNIDDINSIGLSAVAVEVNNVYNYYKRDFHSHYNCSHIPFYFVHHHDAHAYSSYYSSKYEQALVFVFDGGGDFFNGKQESETIYFANNNEISVIDKRYQDLAIRHMRDKINNTYHFMPEIVQNRELSLARKYSQFTHLLGFGFGQEGKTMGLASYGNSLIDFETIKFDSLDFSLTYKDLIKDIDVLQKISGKSFEEYIDDEKENIASTIQAFIEKVVISIVKNYTKKYNVKKVCLSGGLFLNCLTNHKILEKCSLENVFILPASGDDGQALGAAYYAYIKQFGSTKFNIKLPYLGFEYSSEEIESELNKRNIRYEKLGDIELAKKVSELVCNNKIVAIHRGKSEIGPRALCHRSIIANPTNPEMKDILNNRVKHREPFRPFAPTVISEKQFEYFDLKASSPYMLLATDVNENYREALSAVTHVDNTARIQSISKDDDEYIYNLLKNIEKINGYPVLLNTSFNVAGQPIVESPYDAIETFLKYDIDVLAIGNYLLDKDIM